MIRLTLPGHLFAVHYQKIGEEIGKRDQSHFGGQQGQHVYATRACNIRPFLL